MQMLREKVNYEVYDGDKVIATGPACELSEIMDCERKRFNELAKNGGLLKRKYRVKAIGLKPCADYAELDKKIKAEYKLGIKQTRIAQHLKINIGTVNYRIRSMRKRGEVA